MHIICLTPLEEGVYNDHKADHIIAPPDGWAYIPEGFPLPSTFPRLGSLEAEELTYTKEVEGETEPMEYKMVTVTKMTEGTLPEHEPAEEAIPPMEQLRADVDYIAVMTGVEL